MPTPTIDPEERDLAEIAPTDTYHPSDRVWVHRSGVWHAGVVEAASTRAATVTYRPGSEMGTAVDTLTARYLLRRADSDPMLDSQESLTHPGGLLMRRRVPVG